MRRFLSSFFLSWTAVLTVTVFYLLSRLLEDSSHIAAASYACATAFAILFIATAYVRIHHKWIRPRGMVLISAKELEFLTWCHDELADKNAITGEYE